MELITTIYIIYIHIYNIYIIYIYIYIYSYKNNMYWSNIKSKNTCFILTNISVVLHNLLSNV